MIRAWHEVFEEGTMYEVSLDHGSASTLNVTRGPEETAPISRPIGFVWPTLEIEQA